MRAVVYARYSTELQREASIEDKVRLCKAPIEAEGWSLCMTCRDSAQSGASHLRPGYQQMLLDARTGLLDVVVAEALDRLSRDQEHVAALFKQLTFNGVKIVTLAEGEINELHVGVKGTMNALFLKDLGEKVRRGLEGRVRHGRSSGGLCYGYEVAHERDARGELIYGGRKIKDVEAENVRRIFREFAHGQSPRAIAVGLNAERIPGPHGKPWGMSTIYGNWRRGTGILNNELYVGRLIWNRQRFIKDPDSRKRQARLNSRDKWIVQDVPELRIIEDALWASVKERQEVTRRRLTHDGRGVRAERARRPAYLLSGLLRCGRCGGGFAKVRRPAHQRCPTTRRCGA
jgi:site-specific DNA recombinase